MGTSTVLVAKVCNPKAEHLVVVRLTSNCRWSCGHRTKAASLLVAMIRRQTYLIRKALILQATREGGKGYGGNRVLGNGFGGAA